VALPSGEAADLASDQNRAWVIALFGIFAALGTTACKPYRRLSMAALAPLGRSLHPLGWNEAIPYRVHAEFSMAPDLLLGALLTTGTGPCMGLSR